MKFIILVGLPYTFLLAFSMLFGIKDANLTYLTSCNKPSTNIGHYTGLSLAYDIGCQLGRRRE